MDKYTLDNIYEVANENMINGCLVRRLIDDLLACQAKLAEIEAQEPVGEFNGCFRFADRKSYFEVRCFDALPKAGAKIYVQKAQPSPAVSVPVIKAYAENENESDFSDAYVNGWNDCREAMLSNGMKAKKVSLHTLIK